MTNKKILKGTIVDYQIYTHSFLYYGVNEAISRFNEKLIADGKTNKNVPNPCYPKGYNDNGFHGTSDWNTCLSKTLDLFDFNASKTVAILSTA